MARRHRCPRDWQDCPICASDIERRQLDDGDDRLDLDINDYAPGEGWAWPIGKDY